MPEKPAGPPVVDVTMQITEGKQYFVNRITFVGNTTTKDNVIRRELRLYENGIFNTEALKYSVRRLNQLGYFKALEGPPKDVMFEKTPGVDGKMDVKFTLEEQNRNQLSFGAGVSQFEGFFGQLSFQTANFLGRGESLTVSLQAGSRAQNFQVSFTEPFLFDRNITGGANVFKNEVRYVGQFTQSSTGGVLSLGFPLGTGFTRMFANYSYEHMRVSELSTYYQNPVLLAQNPFLRDSLLIGQSGSRVISKVMPSIVHNTVDQPIFPDDRQAAEHVDRPGGPWRQHQLLQADGRGHLVHQAEQPDVARAPWSGRVHQHLQERAQHSDLRAALPRRRIQRARLRSAHHRAV